MSYVAVQYAEMAAEGRFQRAQRAARKEATQILRHAEHAHGRHLAVMVAALTELRLVAPDSLLFNPQVRARVATIGGETIDRSSSFQPVHDLTFDLNLIFKVVQNEHEAAKRAAVSTLESIKAESPRHFWRFWRHYGRIGGQSFHSVAAAEAARVSALLLAKNSVLGDDLNVTRLLRAVT